MNTRELFIELLDNEIFENPDYNVFLNDDEWDSLLKFWKDFKDGKTEKSSKEMTENGKKLLGWMQNNIEKLSNVFTSKEMAEAFFTSGRSVAGSMRKLVNDGYVNKVGKDPVLYSLTEKGKNYQL